MTRNNENLNVQKTHKRRERYKGKYPKLEISDNCKCNSYENKYAVKYDHQYNTIELYRNDINLGVVVQNIKPYLTPALEINLEDCKIQLSSKNLPQEKIYL